MTQPAETASVNSSAPDAGKLAAGVETTPGEKFDLLQVSSVQPSMMAPSSLRQASAKQCKMQTSLAASNAHYHDVTRRQKYPPQLRVGGIFLIKDAMAVPAVCKQWLHLMTQVMDEGTRSAKLAGGSSLSEIPRRLLSVDMSDHVNGGGTRGEWPLNILQDGCEGWNKWYSTGACSEHHPVTIEFKYETDSGLKPSECPDYLVKAYAFRTANDCPGRDPMIWTVDRLAPKSKSKKTTIHNVDLSSAVANATSDSLLMPTRRWAWRTFVLPEPVPFKPGESLVFSFTAQRNARDGRQIGQIALFADLKGFE